MIGREWDRRKAWSGPALIRRGPDFLGRLNESSRKAKTSLGCITQSAKHFTFLEMPEARFLLYSFEECKISSHIRWRWLGGPPVPIPNTEVKHPYAESTWLETAREARELPV